VFRLDNIIPAPGSRLDVLIKLNSYTKTQLIIVENTENHIYFFLNAKYKTIRLGDRFGRSNTIHNAPVLNKITPVKAFHVCNYKDASVVSADCAV